MSRSSKLWSVLSHRAPTEKLDGLHVKKHLKAHDSELRMNRAEETFSVQHLEMVDIVSSDDPQVRRKVWLKCQVNFYLIQPLALGISLICTVHCGTTIHAQITATSATLS